MTNHINSTIAALALAVTAIPTPSPNATPVPLPTSSYECQIVPVPSAAPCYCCSRVTWRNWGRRGLERVEAPVSCSCSGGR